MDKTQFLSALSAQLRGLPEEDRQRALEYYSEMINDRMEDGLTEEEAVAAMDPPEQIARQIISETPMTSIVKARASRRSKPGVLTAVLLVLGAPLWIPLLIAVGSVLLSLYLVIWVLVAVIAVVAFSLVISALAGLVGGVICVFRAGGVGYLLLGLGAALVLFGLGVLMFFLFRAAASGIVSLTRNVVFGAKKRLLN